MVAKIVKTTAPPISSRKLASCHLGSSSHIAHFTSPGPTSSPTATLLDIFGESFVQRQLEYRSKDTGEECLSG